MVSYDFITSRTILISLFEKKYMRFCQECLVCRGHTVTGQRPWVFIKNDF